MPFRERIEWCDVWVADADREDRRRALMIGDSIARSYFSPVEEIVGGRFACARLTTSRSVCDPSFTRELALLLQEYPFELIHLNNGLHGWAYDEPAYAEALGGCMDFLGEQAPASILIWASSTPVWVRGESGVLDPKNERVRERNRLARALAVRRRVLVSDLYAAVEDHPDYFTQDGVHLNADGQRAVAGVVAESIFKAAR